MAAGGLRARRRAVRLAGATSPDARRGARNRPERKPDDPDRRTGGGAVRLCQTPDVGCVAAPGVGQRQLHPLDRQAGGGQGDFVRRGQHAQRHGRRGIAAVCTGRLPHAQNESRAGRGRCGERPRIAHRPDGRSEESVLQYPAGGAVARGAARVGGQRTAHGGRHARAV